MCGIVGKISWNEGQINQSDIHAMLKTQSHRGPDDSGVYVNDSGSVAFGHARLSVIDTSSAGHQPMSWKNQYWITFNGEIYNFQALRKELTRQGYTFTSGTDTEVILALYDKYKEKCVEHLQGMFAFAIYDANNHTVFCARDRIGQKPFKYAVLPNHFMFASEAKAIVTQPEYSVEPDMTAIGHYLTFGYCPAPTTGFKGIEKLKPGHTLTVNLKTKEVTTNAYWQLPQVKNSPKSSAAWQEVIRQELTQAVEKRMIADVPLGAFLSGGIDSSIIVGLMSQLSSTPVQTFSIGFPQKEYNELPYAHIAAKHFNTNHTELTVTPADVTIAEDLAGHFDEPFADSSALATLFLSKLTRQHVTVALSGDGGDEFFAGYKRYKWFSNLAKLRYGNNLPGKTVHAIANIVHSTTPSLRWQRLRQYTHAFTKPYNPATHYKDIIALWPPHENLPINVPASSVTFDQYFSSPDLVQGAMRVDQSIYLPDDLMQKTDITSMAHALEVRSPFLDHQLITAVSGIPTNLLLKDQGKWILKQTFADLIPPVIRNRSKQGFTVPLQAWLKNDITKYMKSMLLSNTAQSRNLYDTDIINQLLHRHQQGSGNYAPQLWSLLMLELWFQQYID